MKEIQLTKGKVALVDEEDHIRLLELGRWAALNPHRNGKTFYAYHHDRAVGFILMHRFLMGLTDRNLQVDHIDGDGLNNQKSNLRIVDKFKQARNVRKISTITLSNYKGVSYLRNKPNFKKRWRGYIKINRKQISLGLFETETEAAKAYDVKAKELFGEYACLNFPKKEQNTFAKMHGLLY
jgi:hypothetical protein